MLTFGFRQQNIEDAIARTEEWKRRMEAEKIHLDTKQKMLGGQYNDWLDR
jgi:hypothetical protein